MRIIFFNMVREKRSNGFNFWYCISSKKWQKGESQNGCFKKKSTQSFPKNEHFLPPDTHTYVCVWRGKKCLFFRKFGVLFSLKHPFWDSHFCFITHDIFQIYTRSSFFHYLHTFSLTHFSPVSHLYIPWKRQKSKGFLTFSGSIEMWHWTKMG